MKKFLLFCSTLFILHSASAQTNVYHPFPESGAVWNQYLYYYCFSGGNDNEYCSYIMAGDTILGTRVYHHIIMTGLISIFDTNCFSFPPYPPEGFIRQDSLNKIIYHIQPPDTTEYIFYDFNIQLGDSIDEGVISSTDSVLIGTTYRKRWCITGCPACPPSFIIEGIGNTNGLFRNKCNPCPYPHSLMYNLNCFIENGVVLYTDGTTQCNIIDAVKNTPEEKNSIAISPNPFHTSATLQIKNEELKNKNCQLKIYNTLGALVLQSSFSNLQSVIISREGMPDGLYFYEVTTTDYELISNGKLIVE